jgi:hypothetical protein
MTYSHVSPGLFFLFSYFWLLDALGKINSNHDVHLAFTVSMGLQAGLSNFFFFFFFLWCFLFRVLARWDILPDRNHYVSCEPFFFFPLVDRDKETATVPPTTR